MLNTSHHNINIIESVTDNLLIHLGHTVVKTTDGEEKDKYELPKDGLVYAYTITAQVTTKNNEAGKFDQRREPWWVTSVRLESEYFSEAWYKENKDFVRATMRHALFENLEACYQKIEARVTEDSGQIRVKLDKPATA